MSAEENRTKETSAWKPMSEAPRNQVVLGRSATGMTRETWFGKTSHVPLYGWCFQMDPDDFENVDLWEPTEWRSE